MRTIIFLAGIVLIISGPAVTLAALSSCVGTILSGHLRACVTDLGFIVLGGVIFFAGLITAIVGAAVSDSPRTPSPYQTQEVSPQPAQFTCKKCGQVYDSARFFCPSCGRRPM